MKSKFLAASLVLTPAALLAEPYNSCPYFYGIQYRGNGIFIIITAVIIITLLIFLLLQYNRNKNNTEIFSRSNNETPLDILNKRLVKGEITEEEYDRLKTKTSG